MKARCKYCHKLDDVQLMRKDKLTEEWYHLSCSARLSSASSDFENIRQKEAESEAIRVGMAKAAQKGKKVGRPRKRVENDGK